MMGGCRSPLVLLLCFFAAQAAPVSSRHGKRASSIFLQADIAWKGAEFGKGNENASFVPNPFAPGQHHHESNLQCGVTEKVGAHTDKFEDCPANCPYFAQNRKDDQHCTFLCVPGAECGRWNPNKPISDTVKNSKTCRGPKVDFCSEPMLDGTDTCQKCQNGYNLFEGQCYFAYWNSLIAGASVLIILFTAVGVWVVDLCCRENVNEDVVARTDEWRARSRIYKPATVPGERRTTWDLSTNTCDPQNDFAGPGMTLHFNFQLFFIIWPIAVAMVWIVLACFHNELFILGTRKFGTPRHNCILVAWGYETQQRLMWTKVLFLAIVYVGSFVSFLWFSIRQQRMYQRMDMEEKTMKDFAIELKGLPEISGKYSNLEKDIQKFVEDATKLKLVGVTVAWNYAEVQEKVDFVCHRDLSDKEGTTPRAEPMDPTENMPALRKWMYNKEKELLGPDDPDITHADVKPMLEEIVSSDVAFAVFNTEKDKNKALADFETLDFDCTKYGSTKCSLTLSEVGNEPSNVNWHNFGDDRPIVMIKNFLFGLFTVYVPALLVWFFCFYVPYACALYYFNYDNGAELPGYYGLIFTIVICGGNATMYVVCDICCDIIGFRYKDTKQKAYMLMYLVACMINVFLDMGVTYYTALKIMVGLDFRTYHGTRLAEIDTFTEQFETYAMQRSLGENTYAYAWPSTFFLCFVLEPFVTIWVPYYIGRALVRAHPEIRGTCAEAYLAAFEFDMGRYADILLNVFLGILIFWFPGGYIWSLFLFMSFSHTFIYCFDHWRVLKVIPYVKVVICEVDWWAQAVMCGWCAMIMMCLVFKANCETYSGYCHQDVKLIMNCALAGLAHFIVHFLLLLYFVPMFGIEEKEETDDEMEYATIAEEEARSWFSMNPVHCLRSKYMHGDKPPCYLCYYGKEHLLEVNPKIGCHFKQEAAHIEEPLDIRKSFTKLFSPRSSDDKA